MRGSTEKAAAATFASSVSVPALAADSMGSATALRNEMVIGSEAGIARSLDVASKKGFLNLTIPRSPAEILLGSGRVKKVQRVKKVHRYLSYLNSHQVI